MGGGLESRCVGRVHTVPETCRAKDTSIKLPGCIKVTFHFISCTYIYLVMILLFRSKNCNTGSVLENVNRA